MKPHQQKFVIHHGTDEDVEKVLRSPSDYIVGNFPFMTKNPDDSNYESRVTHFSEHPVMSRKAVNIPKEFFDKFAQYHASYPKNMDWLSAHRDAPEDFHIKQAEPGKIHYSEVEASFKKLKEGRAGKDGHHFLASPSVSDYQLEEFLDHPVAKKYVSYIGQHRKFMPVLLQEKLFKMDPSSIAGNEHLHPVAQNAIVQVVSKSTSDTSKFEPIFHRADLTKNNVNKFIASGRHAFKMATRSDLDVNQQEAVLKAKSKGLEPSKGFVFSKGSPDRNVLEKILLSQWVQNPKDSTEHAFAVGFWNKLRGVRPLDEREEKLAKTSKALADDKTLLKIKKRNIKDFS